MSVLTKDDNEKILNIIKERMELGIERYGHGIRTNDDTRNWGTKENSWAEMALEEVLDGMVYMAAQIIRIRDVMSVPPLPSPPKKSDLKHMSPRPDFFSPKPVQIIHKENEKSLLDW